MSRTRYATGTSERNHGCKDWVSISFGAYLARVSRDRFFLLVDRGVIEQTMAGGSPRFSRHDCCVVGGRTWQARFVYCLKWLPLLTAFFLLLRGI